MLTFTRQSIALVTLSPPLLQASGRHAAGPQQILQGDLVDFARRRHRYFIEVSHDKPDGRHLERAEPISRLSYQAGQIRAGRSHHRGCDALPTVIIDDVGDVNPLHTGDRPYAGLDLNRVDGRPPYLEHVVEATLVPEVALGIQRP